MLETCHRRRPDTAEEVPIFLVAEKSIELFPRLFLTSRTQKRREKAKKGQNPPRISTLRLFRAQRDGFSAHFPFDVRVFQNVWTLDPPGGGGESHIMIVTGYGGSRRTF